MKNITKISYPNTIEESSRMVYSTDNQVLEKYHCDEIKTIQKNGEQAHINWLQIIKDKKVIAEIKESICDIYGEDPIEKKDNPFPDIPF